MRKPARRKPADDQLKCLRCGHVWLPLVEAPSVCPRCKSYKWQGSFMWKGQVVKVAHDRI